MKKLGQVIGAIGMLVWLGGTMWLRLAFSVKGTALRLAVIVVGLGIYKWSQPRTPSSEIEAVMERPQSEVGRSEVTLPPRSFRQSTCRP